MGLTDFTVNEILDQLFGAAAYTAPATLYAAALLVLPVDADTGSTIVEPTGGSYARKSLTNNLTNFAAAASRLKQTDQDITFATATADWGIIIAVGLVDASSAGNLLWWGELTASKEVLSGNVLKVAAGDLAISVAASS